MADHFNKLTPGEAERLAIFIEECGEAIQAACKVLRHGYESYDPTADPHAQPSNRQSLAKEIGDVRASIEMLCIDIDKKAILEQANNKLVSLRQWTHHQIDSQP